MEMYYPLCAFLTLFANTLQNPQDECAIPDLDLMDLVITFLSPIIVQVSPLSATTTHQIFQELAKVARNFVEKTRSGSGKKTKRGHKADKVHGGREMSAARKADGAWSTPVAGHRSSNKADSTVCTLIVFLGNFSPCVE